MGPAGLGQREGAWEGVKKKCIHFQDSLTLRKSEVGRTFMVATTVRDGKGGSEGQMEELNNYTLQKKKCEGEMISGVRTVRRGT